MTLSSFLQTADTGSRALVGLEFEAEMVVVENASAQIFEPGAQLPVGGQHAARRSVELKYRRVRQTDRSELGPSRDLSSGVPAFVETKSRAASNRPRGTTALDQAASDQLQSIALGVRP